MKHPSLGLRRGAAHNRFRVVALALAGTSLVSLNIRADGSSNFTENDFLGDIPVVSAVSRFEQRIDKAPASVTIIDRELIMLSGAQNIPELFRLVPGFQSYYVSGNRFGVSYHGFGEEFPNQMEVMVDGRSVYESLFSSVHWSTLGIELSDIDHIEVIRGSNAAAQGSNAYLGSINIVTRKPVQDSGLGLQVTAGDWQTRNGSLRYNDALGALDYRVSLSYQENEGFPAVEDGPLEDGHELYHGNFTATYTPSLVDTIELSAGYSHDKTGWGDSDHPDEFSLAQAYSHHQSLLWKHTSSDRSDFEVHIYHNKFDIKNWTYLGIFSDLLGMDENIVNAIYGDYPDFAARLISKLDTPIAGGFGRMLSERYDAQFQHNLRVGDSFRGAWGLGLRNESLEAFHPHSIDRDVDELITRLYGHGEWQLTPRMTLNSGIMVEDSPQDVLYSPRVSLHYSFVPNHTIRLGYARGNRAPSLLEANEYLTTHVDELVVDTVRVADPNLKEEKLNTFELAYMAQWSEPNLQLDLRFFREELIDVITTYSRFNPVEDTFFGDETHKYLSNFGDWDIVGGEVQLKYRPVPGTLLRLHYTNQDLDTPLDNEFYPWLGPSTKGNRMATHSAGLMFAQELSRSWTLSTTAYYQSEVKWEKGDLSKSFTRVDAQLIYKFNLERANGNIRFVAQNLGSDYTEFNDNNIFETRFFITAELELP